MLFDLDSKGFSEKDLTIHLRSGDVFEGDGANAGYGQPPFCFYKYIIEEQKPEKVQVIYEDKKILLFLS